MSKSLPFDAIACAIPPPVQLFNARPMYWLCVVQSVVLSSGSPPVAFARTDHVGRPLARRHSLTLIVFFPNSPTLVALTFACSFRKLTGCVCLHALSSFQRTDPPCALGARTPQRRLGLCPSRSSLGEPSEVIEPTQPCQARKWRPAIAHATDGVGKTPELGTPRLNSWQYFCGPNARAVSRTPRSASSHPTTATPTTASAIRRSAENLAGGRSKTRCACLRPV